MSDRFPASSPSYKLKAVIDSRGVPIELFGSGRSRHLHKLVYNYIATWTNPDGSGAYPGRRKIAADNGLTVRGLANILKWLKDHHLLLIADERSPVNTNQYTVLFSDEGQAKCRAAYVPLIMRGCIEPIVVHPSEKLAHDWISRNRANDRIDAALRAKGGIAIVSPIFNLARRKHFQTVEATTQIAFRECRAVVA